MPLQHLAAKVQKRWTAQGKIPEIPKQNDTKMGGTMKRWIVGCSNMMGMPPGMGPPAVWSRDPAPHVAEASATTTYGSAHMAPPPMTMFPQPLPMGSTVPVCPPSTPVVEWVRGPLQPRRRGGSCDLAEHSQWTTFLYALRRDPPPGYPRATIVQLVQCDRAAWSRLGRTIENIRQDGAGNYPLARLRASDDRRSSSESSYI